MKNKIEKNIHNNKNNDLKDLKIITCRNDWIVNHKLHQQMKNEQQHEWEIIQHKTDNKNNNQIQ